MHDTAGILVLIDTDDTPRELVREAGRLAVETGLGVTLLSVFTTTAYERRRRALQSIPQLSSYEYSLDQALDGARYRAERFGLEELEPFGVRYTTPVEVADRLDRLSDIASDFEYVFVAARPTGWLRRRPRLGAVARALTRQFEGDLTVVPRPVDSRGR